MSAERMTRLEQLRRDEPLTQAELARATGVATSVISRIEDGHGARGPNLKALAGYFKVPASDLTREALPVAVRQT